MPVASADRAMPHDLEAEEWVLGAILLDQDAIAKIPFLRPEHFYRENNGEVLRAARALFARGEPVDNVTLAAELGSMGSLDRIGGRVRIATLVDSVPTASNVTYHADIVRSKAIKRFGIQRAQDLIQKGYDDQVEENAFVSDFQRIALGLADTNAVGAEPIPVGSMLDDFMVRLAAAEQGHRRGLSTGFPSLDRVLEGMMPGHLIYVAGRASMGKTALGMNIAVRVAQAKKPVAVFSLEMSKEELVERVVAQTAMVSAKRLRRGYLSEQERDRVHGVMGPLSELPLLIDETTGLDELTLAARCRSLAIQERGLSLVLVDYVQLLRSSRNFKDNRVQEVGYLSRSLKQLARDLQVPVIALAQLSRAPDSREKDKRPRLSDLRDSGELEQDADAVVFVYRGDYYDPNDDPGLAEAIVAKNRNGEAPATVKLRFNKDQTRFDDFEDREEPPEVRRAGRLGDGLPDD